MAKRRRAPRGTARADAADWKAERLINQDFGADATDEKWLTDITEIPCIDGKPCLVPGTRLLRRQDSRVLDGRQHEGRPVRGRPEAGAQEGARLRGPGPSGRGSQSASEPFRAALDSYGAVQPLSSVGSCHGNPGMESRVPR